MTAFVGLGANLGDPARQILEALERLNESAHTELLQRSSLYRSPPQGPQDQPDFCNAVCSLKTGLEPEALLDLLQHIEAQAGRQREAHWGPRTLDLDLLCYGRLRIDSARLTLPHPWVHRRAFVLLPLLEVAPNIDLPGLGPARRWLEQVDAAGVRVW